MLKFHITINENDFEIWENRILVFGYEFDTVYYDEEVDHAFGKAQLAFRGIAVHSLDVERAGQIARMTYASGYDPQVIGELDAVLQELWPKPIIPWVTSTLRLTLSPPILSLETRLDLMSGSMAKRIETLEAAFN